jgi:mRNA-degrading endonuclease toxin of MazEF toxin-antitoxin module
MKIRRGDVVLVDYLFSDRRGSKIRPCLVVQADARNQVLNDTIVAAISSKVTRTSSEPTQLLKEIHTSEGAKSGLLFDSAVQCGNLATIDASLVIRNIGPLPVKLMRYVDNCLTAALGL